MFPLTFSEIPDFDLLTYLNTGGLPYIYGNPDAEEELANYVGTYLSENHLKGLRALKEEGLLQRYLVVSLDLNERITRDGIEIVSWQMFLGKLWSGQLF